jgi:hypothetical protein
MTGGEVPTGGHGGGWFCSKKQKKEGKRRARAREQRRICWYLFAGLIGGGGGQGHGTGDSGSDRAKRKQRGRRKGIFPSTCAQIQKIQGPRCKEEFNHCSRVQMKKCLK